MPQNIPITPFGRTLVKTADAAAARTVLGVSGTDTTTKLIVCDGNSLTRGFPEGVGLTYPTILRAMLSGGWSVTNLGVDGQTTEQMLADAATQVDPLFNAANARNIIVVWPCLQSITGGETAAQVYTTVTTYIQGRQAAGFEVIVMTMMKWGSASGGNETIRQALNVLIIANTAGADLVVDIAADSRLSNTADVEFFYSDATHLNALGYTVVAGLLAAELHAAYSPGEIVSPKISGGTTDPNSVVVLEATKVIVEGLFFIAGATSTGQIAIGHSDPVTGIADMRTASGLTVVQNGFPNLLAVGIERVFRYPVLQGTSSGDAAVDIYIQPYGGNTLMGAATVLPVDGVIKGHLPAGDQSNRITPYDSGSNLVIDHRHTSAGGILLQQAGVTYLAVGLHAVNIPVRTPAALADGDVWREDNTNTGLKIRVNGMTKTVSLV